MNDSDKPANISWEDIRRMTGEILKKGRLHKGLTIEQAAAELSLPLIELQALEDGTAWPPLNIVFRAVEFYGDGLAEIAELYRFIEKGNRG